METPFMEEIPDKELMRLAVQAEQGGEYEFARNLIRREQERRAMAILAMHSVDMPVSDPAEYLVPVDPMEGLECEGCS